MEEREKKPSWIVLGKKAYIAMNYPVCLHGSYQFTMIIPTSSRNIKSSSRRLINEYGVMFGVMIRKTGSSSPLSHESSFADFSPVTQTLTVALGIKWRKARIPLCHWRAGSSCSQQALWKVGNKSMGHNFISGKSCHTSLWIKWADCLGCKTNNTC